jgi:hypothetical protein
MASNDQPKPPFRKAYGFALITAVFFLFSWAGQFIFQLIDERNNAAQHGEAFSPDPPNELRMRSA